MSAEAWSALAATIGVIVVIIFQIVEWRRLRLARALDSVLELEKRFEESEFRDIRKAAATFLLDSSAGSPEGEGSAVTVINFFECLGLLHRKAVLDDELVWHFFSGWLLPYYCAAHQSIITPRQGRDPNAYTEVDKLYRDMKRIEETKHPSGDTLHIITREAIHHFLEGEAGH